MILEAVCRRENHENLLLKKEAFMSGQKEFFIILRK